MSCTCFIFPPCSYCVDCYECTGCGDIRNSKENGMNWNNSDPFCNMCWENPTEKQIGVCECGKDKHNFMNHSQWCSKYEDLWKI